MLHLQIKGYYTNKYTKRSKKQLAILSTSILMSDKKTKEKLEQVSCIWYLMIFKD